MIYGIGIDLIQIRRIERVINKWGERFISRVFTEDEIKICHGRAFPASAFALRFAAKEAFSKAIGLGMKKGVIWRDIEVYHLPEGRPCLRIHGRSLEICKEKQISGFHLSLSDEGEYGTAIVVLESSDKTAEKESRQ